MFYFEVFLLSMMIAKGEYFNYISIFFFIV